MSKRAPKFTIEEMHALTDGCLQRWDILRSNINSDQIVKMKQTAWEQICTEVNAVNRTGTHRKWEELRRKIQVEKSNVKKRSKKYVASEELRGT